MGPIFGFRINEMRLDRVYRINIREGLPTYLAVWKNTFNRIQFKIKISSTIHYGSIISTPTYYARRSFVNSELFQDNEGYFFEE